MAKSSRSPISRTLTVEECWSLVGTSGVGRVGLTVDGTTRIVPVNYSVADDTVYFRTAPGTVLSNVASQKVAFEVDDFDAETRSGWSVCIIGSGLACAEGVGLDVDTWAPGQRDKRYRVVTDEVTGRKLYGSSHG